MNATRKEAKEALDGILTQELGGDFSDDEIEALAKKLMTGLDDVEVFFVDEDDEAIVEGEEEDEPVVEDEEDD